MFNLFKAVTVVSFLFLSKVLIFPFQIRGPQNCSTNLKSALDQPPD